MPLKKGRSDSTIRANIKEQVASGKAPEQAAAIAYSQAKDGSARKVDSNGWVTIKDNPISKVGVYPYLRENLGLDGDGVIMVYRPAEEIGNPETIDSFRGVPFIDNHTFLGENGENLDDFGGAPAVVGDDVWFDEERGMLLGKLKIFSPRMMALIEKGKRELSPGYTARYDMTPGEWNGQPYEAVQRDIRGNHLALVEQGRTGPDVAVLDHKFTIDRKDFAPMEDEKKAAEPEAPANDQEPDLAAQVAELEKGMAEMKAFIEKLKPMEQAEHPELAEKSEPAEDEGEPDKMKTDTMDAADLKKAMDQAIQTARAQAFKDIADRQALVDRLTPHIGVFDTADRTPDQVAAYGLAKLGIKAPKGGERVFLDAYLSGLEKSASSVKTADHAELADRSAFLKRMGE